MGRIRAHAFSHLLFQTHSQTKEVSVVMPFDVWNCLMEPLVDGGDGLDWDCNRYRETLFVEEEGLAQLDYLFGVAIPHLPDWKSRTVGLGSTCKIESITLLYVIEKCTLTMKARHPYN